MSTVPTITLDELRTDEVDGVEISGDGNTIIIRCRNESDAIMRAQREARRRLVPIQRNVRGTPIVTHSLPKFQRPTGKQIRAARKAAREAAKRAKPEIV